MFVSLPWWVPRGSLSAIAMLLIARSTLAAEAAPVDRIVLPQCLHHPLYDLCTPNVRGGARAGVATGLELHHKVRERVLNSEYMNTSEKLLHCAMGKRAIDAATPQLAWQRIHCCNTSEACRRGESLASRSSTCRIRRNAIAPT